MSPKSLIKSITPAFALSAYHMSLAFLAALWYRFPSESMIVVGVTGTKGKSTTTALIHDMLAAGGRNVRQLGNTLAAIAREKAGIIKPGVPVVCGVTAPEAQAVIAEVAQQHGCRLIQLGSEFHYRYRPAIDTDATIDFNCTVAGQEQRLSGVPLAMRGPHQAENGAVALAAAAELRHQGWCISTDAMRRGLATAWLPARVEFLAGPPAVVLDTAHNGASARALVESLAEFAPSGRRTLILSVSHDKDVAAIVRELVPSFDRVVVTQYQDNPRAVAADQLANLVREVAADVTICVPPRAAWDMVCRTAEAGELACVAGSFFLAAEMRPMLLAQQDAAAT